MVAKPPERAQAKPSVWVLLIRLCVPLLLAAALGGCVSKSKAKAQARAAYLAGQQQAMTRMQLTQTQGQGPCVTVNGEVRNHVVLWTEGLTLAKAVLAADYYGTADPGQIIIVHNGIAIRVDPKQLLTGVDVPLQPGDIVQLVPPVAAPKP
jgi:molybdopterin converting factor small subunit